MKKIFENILLLSMNLLWILNFSSGIIATLWLLFSGGWQLVLFGFILGIMMPWAYSISQLPVLLLSPIIIKFAEKGRANLTTLLGFMISLYTNFIMALWVSFVFGIMLEVNFHPLALWLWGYATVMGPVGYMAGKEGKDIGSGTTLGVLFAQISYLLLSFGFYVLGTENAGYNLVWLLIFLFSGFTSLILRDSAKPTEQEYINPESDLYTINEKVEEAKVISSLKKKASYCTNCGNKIKSKSNFCTNCGKSLKG